MGPEDRPPPASPADDEAEPSLKELFDRGTRRVTTALVIAGAIVGVAIYARPAPPRYDAIADEGRVVRIDRRTGTLIACDTQKCAIILRRGQRVDRLKALPAPNPPVQPAAPALPKAAG